MQGVVVDLLITPSLYKRSLSGKMDLTLHDPDDAAEVWQVYVKHVYLAYLNALERLFVTENIRPFSPSLRSSTRIKQAEKRRFCDPSIAAALLKATPARLERDLNTLGFLFESLVLRDLLCYAEAFDASVYHYQDYCDREIDAVIEMPDGEWTAVEVKLGVNQEETAAKHLLDIQRRIAETGGHTPQSLAIVVGLSSAAYRRPDGVYVLPITALKT